MPTSNLILPAGGLLLAFLLSQTVGAKKKRTTKKKPSAEKQCPPYRVIDREEVLQTANLGLENGLETVGQVSAYVGAVLYPVDPNGVTIPWPTEKPYVLPPDSLDATVCLLAEIKSIVSELPLKEDPEDEQKPGEVLTDLLAPEPTFGKFYLIRHYDPKANPAMPSQVALGSKGLIAQALNRQQPGAGSGNATRLAVLKMMTTPKTWNVDLYGRQKFTDNWPAYTGVDGRNIGTAWLPRHKRAIESIALGKMPTRNIDQNGTKVGEGGAYGLLWFPPIDAGALESLGVVTDAGLKWSDGSSTRNPPPELLKLLTN